jgi:hypothetical protein
MIYVQQLQTLPLSSAEVGSAKGVIGTWALVIDVRCNGSDLRDHLEKI